MGNPKRQRWDKPAEAGGHGFNVGDAGNDDEALAATASFPV